METRTVEFFEKKVEQIDVKIEKCFKAFEEGSEHLNHYKLIADGVEIETTYVSVSSMVSNINRLEELREFYLKKIKEAENPISRAVRKSREKQ